MDYNSLVGDVATTGSIRQLINWSRVDAEGILAEAQAWIIARIRVRQMLASADVAIAPDASSAAFPPGYLDPIHLGIPGVVPRIRLNDIEFFRTRLGADEAAVLPAGPPTLWADLDGAIQLNTRADQAYTARLAFYRRPDALSPANPGNFLTERYPTLLRRSCLMLAAEERKEYDTMDRAELKAMAMIDDIRRESDLALRGLELDFNWQGSD